MVNLTALVTRWSYISKQISSCHLTRAMQIIEKKQRENKFQMSRLLLKIPRVLGLSIKYQPNVELVVNEI